MGGRKVGEKWEKSGSKPSGRKEGEKREKSGRKVGEKWEKSGRKVGASQAGCAIPVNPGEPRFVDKVGAVKTLMLEMGVRRGSRGEVRYPG